MRTSSIAALSALTIAVSAIPMVKRDIVWVTEVDIDTVIIPVTKTVWVDYPGVSAVEAVVSHSKHHHGHLTSTVTITPTSTIVAVSSATPVESTSTLVAVGSTSTPVAVAPTTTSTSAYVAPTTSVYVAPTTSSTSSVYVAPTTSVYVAPTTSVYVAPSSTTAEPASTVASASGSSYTGALTYYAVGLGSCGLTSTEDQAVVALDKTMMTADWTGNPNNNPLCGKEINITYNGVSKTATIVDTCPGCTGTAGLDLSQSLFEEFAPTSQGVCSGAVWSFV